MTRRMISTLLATASIAAAAAPADAQRYYMRERIAGLPTSSATPTPTYVPVYSSTYDRCNGTTQSRPIASCTTSDGQTTELSNCSSFPQSKDARACTLVCGTMANRIFGPAGGGEINLGSAASAADAKTLCTNGLTSNGYGACGWNSGQKIAYFWKGKDAVDRGTTNTDHLWGATCQ